MKKNSLIIFLLLILIGGGIGTYLFLQQDDEKTKVDTDNTGKKTYSELVEYTGNGGISLWYDASKLVYNASVVDCYISFSFDDSVGEIKEISARYELTDGLEFVDMIVAKRSGFDLKKDGNEFELIANKSMAEVNKFAYFKVKVGENVAVDELSISLKDIVVVNTEGKIFSLNDCSEVIFLNKQENYKYEKDSERKSFIFYKYDNVNNVYNQINEYECVAVDCFPYATQHMSFVDNFTGNMLIVKEVNNTNHFVLIDYEDGVIGTYKNVYYGMYIRGEFNSLDYLIVETFKGEKQIISPYDGRVIGNITDYELNPNMKYSIAQRFYSIEKNRLVVAKDGKWGVIDMTTGNAVVDLKYEDVKIFDDYRYVAKENGKWYFYEFEGNIKKVETGYDEIIYLTSDMMLVQDGEYIYFKNLEGNNLIDDKIEVFVEYNEFACCAMQSGVRVVVDGSTLDIYVDTVPDEDYNYSVYHYRYNGMNNTLEKLQ